MRLIGILSWYEEPTWALAELVASVADAGADAIVAVDGAYAEFPEGRPQSPHEQAQVILATAQGCGMEAVVQVPQHKWLGNEIVKRTHSFALAATIAEPGEDWLWILDGDEVVAEAMGLREALAATEHETASVMMEEIVDGQREGIVPIRKFFKAQESGIRFINNHFTIVSGDGKLLYEGFQKPKDNLVPCEHLGFMRIDHRRGGRSIARNHAAQVYYDRRKERALELVPG